MVGITQIGKDMGNSFQIKERVAVNEHSIQYCFVHPSSIVYISVDCIKETLSNYGALWKQMATFVYNCMPVLKILCENNMIQNIWKIIII